VQHDAGLQRDDASGQFHQPQPQRVELRDTPGGAPRHQAAQRPQQPIGAGVQYQAELVGGGAAARSPVGGEMALPRLDVAFGLAAPAVEILVDRARRSGSEVGDDEARVGVLRADLDAGYRCARRGSSWR